MEVACVPQVSVHELRSMIEERERLQVIDVRRPTEYVSGHVPGAINAQLAQLKKFLENFDPARETAIICAGGYRSSAATSIFEQHGFQKLFNVMGGTGAWIEAGFPVEEEKAAAV